MASIHFQQMDFGIAYLPFFNPPRDILANMAFSRQAVIIILLLLLVLLWQV